MARSIGSIGNSALFRGDYDLARSEYQHALAIMRERGDRGGIAVNLLCLAGVAYRTADLATAQGWIAECIELSQQLGSFRLGEAMRLQAQISLAEGDLAGSAAALTEALEEMRRFGHKGGIAMCIAYLGRVASEQGEITLAKERLRESIPMFNELGSMLDMAEGIAIFASVLFQLGRPIDAARLWGWERGTLDGIAPVRDPITVERYEREVAAARQACEDASFDLAWAEGRAWSMNQLVQFAMSV
jgi:tetratricopeptide (TPR) repeat protein